MEIQKSDGERLSNTNIVTGNGQMGALLWAEGAVICYGKMRGTRDEVNGQVSRLKDEN